MARVAVVGGGVAGLSAARTLARRGHGVLVLEASERLGGKLRTRALRDRPIDVGPDAFIARDPAATELARDLGLASALASPRARGVAIFTRGRLRPLPAGLRLGVPTDLAALWRSGVLPPAAVARVAADLVLPGRALPADPLRTAESGGSDPTIADVLGRLGPDTLDVLIEPLLGGINAGDVRSLSFASAAPTLAESLAGKRSVLRALRTPPGPAPADGPVFHGITGGMERLVDALVDALGALGVELRCDSPVDALVRDGDGWKVRSGAGDERVDGLVLAVPAFVAAGLLGPIDAALASECAAIPTASVVTVTAAYDAAAVPVMTSAALAGAMGARGHAEADPLPGNGVLVPRRSGALTTAFTFVSSKWPETAAPGEVVIRASVGRFGDERPAQMDDPALARAVGAEAAAILGITAEAGAVLIQRWPRSFPQAIPGHRARQARIAAAARTLPAFALCGAAYRGIGIPACIRSGAEAADAVATQLDGATFAR